MQSGKLVTRLFSLSIVSRCRFIDIVFWATVRKQLLTSGSMQKLKKNSADKLTDSDFDQLKLFELMDILQMHIHVFHLSLQFSG